MARVRWALVHASIRFLTTIAALAAAVVVPGCGSSGSPTTSSTRTETPQSLPKLPADWKRYDDSSIGYAIGLPPGWKARHVRGQVSLIQSADHLVSVRITADRTSEGLDTPVVPFARAVIDSLPGYEHLHAGKPRAFRGTPLQGARVVAEGTPKHGGPRTTAIVVVLRRPHLVNYTVLLTANANPVYAPKVRAYDLAPALRMLQTLRDRPVANAVAPQ
jgi:hypothetical protein